MWHWQRRKMQTDKGGWDTVGGDQSLGWQTRGEGGFHTVTDGLNFNCFGDLLLGCGQHRATADFRLKQRVHQSRLSQAALSCKRKYRQWQKHTVRESGAHTRTQAHKHKKKGLQALCDKLQVSVCTNTHGKATHTHDCNANTPLLSDRVPNMFVKTSVRAGVKHVPARVFLMEKNKKDSAHLALFILSDRTACTLHNTECSSPGWVGSCAIFSCDHHLPTG